MTIQSKKIKIQKQSIFISFVVRYNNGATERVRFKRTNSGIFVDHPIPDDLIAFLEPEATRLIEQVGNLSIGNSIAA